MDKKRKKEEYINVGKKKNQMLERYREKQSTNHVPHPIDWGVRGEYTPSLEEKYAPDVLRIQNSNTLTSVIMVWSSNHFPMDPSPTVVLQR